MSRLADTYVVHATGALGDEHLFDQLYEAHFDFVYRCVRRLGVGAGYAEDATQDTFVVLHRRLADLRPDASPRAFLFATASRIARDYRRSHARRGTSTLIEESASEPGASSPFEDAANAQAAQVLEHFLSTLEEPQREVFMLIELEDMTAPEVSDALGVKLNTVYSRLRLGRERLMRFLRSQGLTR